MQCSIVQIGMLVIGCSVGHDGYWMSYWHWWFLDTLFIVVIGRFDKHKYKNRLRTKLYDKTADLNFPLELCIYMLQYSCCIWIWNTITKLIRYSGAHRSYQRFRDRRLLLTKWLLNHLLLVVMCMSSIWMCYGRHHDWLSVT